MSPVELIAQADARGLACLDRCLPLLDGDDDVLRPLWATLADADVTGNGLAWAPAWERVRGDLAGPDAAGEDEAVPPARRMPAAAPAGGSAAEVRAWADACSVASLRIHRLLDPAPVAAGGAGTGREEPARGTSPLVAPELRRQVTVLELPAGHGPAGLRGALDVSVEGRRVLRAVVSRRARGRG